MLVRYGPGSPPLQLLGALYTEPVSGNGVRPHRLPAEVLTRVPGAFMRAVVDSAAGVRLRFRTRATSVTLVAAIHILEFSAAATFVASVDLVIDGVLVESRRVDGGSVTVDAIDDRVVEHPTSLQHIVFDGLSPDQKVVEVWLPHCAIVDLYELLTNESAEPIPTHRPVWLHHGSSISHCLEASHPTGMWPSVASRRLDYDLLSLGFAGSAMLDPFVARVIRDQPADVISLKLGINLVNVDLMKERAFVPAVHGFLDTIRDGHPDTPIVVISPIFCPSVESRPGPTVADDSTGLTMSMATDPPPVDSLTLERIRGALSSIVAERAPTDPRLAYLDGREMFGATDDADGHLPDGLHPDAYGYELMGARFARLIPRLISGSRAAPASRLEQLE